MQDLKFDLRCTVQEIPAVAPAGRPRGKRGTSTTIFHMNDVLLAYNAKVQSLLAEMKANARQGI